MRRTVPRKRLLCQRETDAEERHEDAETLGQGEPLGAEDRGEEHRQQGKGREDQRGAGRGDVLQREVQQRHHDAELDDPEQRDGQQILPLQPHAACEQRGWQQAAEANRVAQQR